MTINIFYAPFLLFFYKPKKRTSQIDPKMIYTVNKDTPIIINCINKEQERIKNLMFEEFRHLLK